MAVEATVGAKLQAMPAAAYHFLAYVVGRIDAVPFRLLRSLVVILNAYANVMQKEAMLNVNLIWNRLKHDRMISKDELLNFGGSIAVICNWARQILPADHPDSSAARDLSLLMSSVWPQIQQCTPNPTQEQPTPSDSITNIVATATKTVEPGSALALDYIIEGHLINLRDNGWREKLKGKLITPTAGNYRGRLVKFCTWSGTVAKVRCLPENTPHSFSVNLPIRVLRLEYRDHVQTEDDKTH